MTAPAMPMGRRITGRAEAGRRLVANRKVLAGVALLAFFCLLALSHPLLQATVWAGRSDLYDPQTGYDATIAHPSGPSVGHLLGTDSLGRDVASLLTFAVTPTLLVALTVATTVGLSSTLAGGAAAYFRKRVDRWLTHLADALVLLPPPIALLVVGIGRPDFGPIELGLLYGLLYGLGPAAIVVRSRALTVMQKPFMQAARVAGGGPGWIIATHLVPHLLPYAAVQMMAGVTGALITQGFIEFFGAAETRIGLGSLVYLGLTYQSFLSTAVAWTQLLAGALSISLMAASFYLVSVGLREAVDPRLQAEG